VLGGASAVRTSAGMSRARWEPGAGPGVAAVRLAAWRPDPRHRSR